MKPPRRSLDLAAYRELAELHRPVADELVAEIKRMADSGLTALDISTAMRLDLGEVYEALGDAVGAAVYRRPSGDQP